MPPEDPEGAAPDEDHRVGDLELTAWYTPAGRAAAREATRVATRVGPLPGLVITLAVGIVIAVALVLVFAQIYDAVTEADGVAGLDHPVLAFAMSLRSPSIDAMATVYTNVGGVIVMPILAVGIMVLIAVRRRSWTPVVLVTAAGAGSLLMTIFGKHLFGRSRPPHADAVPPFEHGASFPSGHTLNSIVIAGIIAYLLIQRQESAWTRALTITLAALFTLTIGISRVFLGAHWFTDVIAAWAIGGAWLAVVITAHRLYLSAKAPALARRHARGLDRR